MRQPMMDAATVRSTPRLLAALPVRTRMGGFGAILAINASAFLRRVLGVLLFQFTVTLILTAAAVYTPGGKGLLQQWSWMVWFGAITTSIILFLMINRRHVKPTNTLLLMTWTITQAYTVAAFAAFFDLQILLHLYVLLSSAVFALLGFACQARFEFNSPAPWVLTLVVVLICSFALQVLLFLNGLETFCTLLLSLLACGHILFDLSLALRTCTVSDVVSSCLGLYTDVFTCYGRLCGAEREQLWDVSGAMIA